MQHRPPAPVAHALAGRTPACHVETHFDAFGKIIAGRFPINRRDGEFTGVIGKHCAVDRDLSETEGARRLNFSDAE